MRSKWVISLTMVSAAALVAAIVNQRPANAQSASPIANFGPSIQAAATISAAPGVERASETIAANAALAPSGAMPAVLSLTPLPTMPADRYAALKAAANAAAGLPKAPAVAAPLNAPVISGGINFPGARQGVVGTSAFPSDDDMDVSGSQVVQLTNSSMWVFSKTGTVLLQTSLNSLFGTGHFVGDVQVLFDSTWHRWVVMSDDFTSSSLWLAISKTSSAVSGGWYIYHFTGANFGAPNILDYPHMGMDQDAILFTGNVFDDTDAYIDTDVFAIPKARLYNGLGFSVPVFGLGLIGTIMPPIQLGKPFYGHFPVDYFAVAASGVGLSLYAMIDASTSPIMSGASTIASTTFAIPPNAVQPGCPNDLDTLDGRFQNACYQVPPFSSFSDGLLYCVHTVGSGPFPVPVWMAFDPSGPSIAKSGDFFLSFTSDDFNPAIAADGLGDIFVTETATDPTGSKKPMVLFGGALAATNPVVALNATPAASSSVCLSGNSVPANSSPQRWGDYSAARFDPATSFSGTPGQVIGWITNQKVAGANNWGTKITKISQ